MLTNFHEFLWIFSLYIIIQFEFSRQKLKGEKLGKICLHADVPSIRRIFLSNHQNENTKLTYKFTYKYSHFSKCCVDECWNLGDLYFSLKYIHRKILKNIFILPTRRNVGLALHLIPIHFLYLILFHENVLKEIVRKNLTLI